MAELTDAETQVRFSLFLTKASGMAHYGLQSSQCLLYQNQHEASLFKD